MGCGSRDVDLYELEASLVVYIVSSRLARLHNRTLSHINKVRNLECKLAQLLGLLPCVETTPWIKASGSRLQAVHVPTQLRIQYHLSTAPNTSIRPSGSKIFRGRTGQAMRYLPANSCISPWNPNSSWDYSLHNFPRSLMELNNPEKPRALTPAACMERKAVV